MARNPPWSHPRSIASRKVFGCSSGTRNHPCVRSLNVRLQLAIGVTNLTEHALAHSLARSTGCAFETRKKLFLSNHGSPTPLSTWSWISRTRRSRTSFVTSLRKCTRRPGSWLFARVRLRRFIYRAKAFIDCALQGGGRVLVHCNGAHSLG